MPYLHWKEETIADFSAENIAAKYDDGFVFTRKGKGVMQQTRSCRVDLSKFALSSENRRILKKVEDIELCTQPLPLNDYDYTIGKFAKDFYDAKFGKGVMSVQKIKEMLTDRSASNFNALLRYTKKEGGLERTVGCTICYTQKSIMHYSYPFYDLTDAPKDMGLGMMTKAIHISKEIGHKHFYLGSLQRPGDTYKLQFEGLEWFDGKAWRTDTEEVKKILATNR